MRLEVISARETTGTFRRDSVFYAYNRSKQYGLNFVRLDAKDELTTDDIADFVANLRSAISKVSPVSKIDTFKINPKNKTVSGIYSTKFEKFAFTINRDGSISTKGVKAKGRTDAVAMTLRCGQTAGSRQCGGRCLPSEDTCHVDTPDVIEAGTHVLNHLDQMLTHGIDTIADKYQELMSGAKDKAMKAVGGVEGIAKKATNSAVTTGVNHAIHAAGAVTGVGKVAGAFANAGFTIGKMIKKKSVEYSNEKHAQKTSASIAEQRKITKQIKPLRVRILDEFKSPKFLLALEKNFVKDLAVGGATTAVSIVNPLAGTAIGLGLGGKIGKASHEALRKTRRKVRKSGA